MQVVNIHYILKEIQMHTANKKKKRKKNKSRQSVSLIMTFACTLTAVVIVGLVVIFAANYLQNRDISAEENLTLTDNTQNLSNADDIVFETIPEKNEEPVEEVEKTEETIEIEPEIIQDDSKYGEIIGDEEYLKANRIYLKPDSNSVDEVTITFAGDILFDSNYAVTSTMLQNGGEISAGISPELINIMKESDLFMLNNEFPYSNGGSPTEGKQYTFRANPSTAKYLNDLDVDLVSIANNHAYDYGEQAFLDTIDALNAVDVPFVGGGRDIEEASSPVYYIINDIKIGFLAATQIERLENPDTKGATDTTPGVFRCWNNERLLAKISEVKQNCDYLVIYIHWGTESTTEIDWAQQKQGPEMVSAGADLIIGDHPHVLQPITVIDGVPVIYSLGNFWFNSREMDTCLVQATINENGLKSLQFIPCIQSGCKTRLLLGDEAQRVINNMRAMSPRINIDSQGYITY